LNVLIHLFHYISKRKKLAIGVLFFIIIAQIAELAIPILVGSTIDSILNALEAGTFKVEVLGMGVFLILFFSLLRGLTYFLARWMGYIQGEGIIFDIRKDLFQTYENSSLDFFDKHHTGDLMSRATTDLEPMSEFLVWGERIFLQAFLTYVGIYTVLFLVDIRLFLLIGVVTPILFILAYFVSTKLGPLYFRIRSQYGRLTTVIQENIAGAQIVRAFNAESREKKKFDKENMDYMSLRAYAFKIRSFFLPLILLVVNLLITILIYAGGLQVIGGEISPGFLITLFSYFTMLAMPTRFLAFALIMYQRVSAAGERVFTLIESPSNIEISENAIKISSIEPPTITFDKVSFAYQDRRVLSKISIEIRPGERIAILGPTGSGKSTIISLIPRFYDVTEGNIYISLKGEKYDVKDLDLTTWRRMIGFVHQEPFLFGRTLRENITFGIENVTESEIEHVIEIAQLKDFVSNLPNGLDTMVGERGVTLSGGQKQRVAIARMILRKRPIMILDDATSSLDISTETAFQNAFMDYLNSFQTRPTVIFITQRLSTLKIVDRIIILNKGVIIEQGAHNELLEHGQIYPLLWRTQEAGLVDIKLALEKIVQEDNL